MDWPSRRRSIILARNVLSSREVSRHKPTTSSNTGARIKLGPILRSVYARRSVLTFVLSGTALFSSDGTLRNGYYQTARIKCAIVEKLSTIHPTTSRSVFIAKQSRLKKVKSIVIVCARLGWVPPKMMGNVLERDNDITSTQLKESDTPDQLRQKLLIRRSFSRLYPEYTHPATIGTTNQITSRQTSWIRRYCDSRWADYYMSKSLRVGSIVEMEMNNALCRSHGVARSGHSDNHNAYDNYAQVPLDIVATGGRALAGWPNPKEPEVIPTFCALTEENKNLMMKFSLTKLFGAVSVAEFMLPQEQQNQPKNVGRLLPFLIDIAATMLGAIHRFEGYHWLYEYKKRAVYSGVFEHLWHWKINPSFEDKMEKIHYYLVGQSELVHKAWVKERTMRDAAYDDLKSNHSTMGSAAVAMLFSDLASNQHHLAVRLQEQQVKMEHLTNQNERILQRLELISRAPSPLLPVALSREANSAPVSAGATAGTTTTITTPAVTNKESFSRQGAESALGAAKTIDLRDVNKRLTWSNKDKRSAPVRADPGDGKRQLAAPELSKIIMDLWTQDKLKTWLVGETKMYRLCRGPFNSVSGYDPNEHAKLTITAKAFEWVLTEREKSWLKKVFDEPPKPGQILEKARKLLILIDKRILVLALWRSNKNTKYKDNISLSYSALAQRYGKDWDMTFKMPPIGEGVRERNSDETSLVQLLARKYPEARLKVDEMLDDN